MHCDGDDIWMVGLKTRDNDTSLIQLTFLASRSNFFFLSPFMRVIS